MYTQYIRDFYQGTDIRDAIILFANYPLIRLSNPIPCIFVNIFVERPKTQGLHD